MAAPSPESTVPAQSEPALRPTWRKRALTGATWTVFGHGAQQIIRLISNILLTRLLVPEAFGLMTLANIFVMGLEMLSDVGVGPAIVHSKHGDEQRFLDTAWTIQVVRGFILLGFAVLIAWPAAWLYHEPRLTPLLIVTGLGIVIRGFAPTRIHSLQRQVLLGRLTMVELVCQVLTLGVMVMAAWWLRSVWALAIGTVFGDFARVALSNALLPGRRHRFLLDREVVGELVRVGRWVIASTAVTFAAGNLDRMTMGRLLSLTDLGVYTIAFSLVSSLVNLGRTVGGRVLFPVLAETAREHPERLYQRLRKTRLACILPMLFGLLLLAIWGDWLIHLLYRREFSNAGWMLRVLAAGSIVAVINQTTSIIWPALGQFRIITLLMVVQVPVLLVAMFVGHALYGIVGFVVACALVELVIYPIQAVLVARRKLWQPELDLTAIAFAALIVGLGAWLR